MGNAWTWLGWGNTQPPQSQHSRLQHPPRQPPPPPIPSPIECLSATPDERHGSVVIKWERPAKNWPQVTGYEIRYRKKETSHDNIKVVHTKCEEHVFTPNDDLEPPNSYLFEVRPTSRFTELTEWRSTVVLIRWHCRHPGCTNDRRKRHEESSFSDFCSSNCTAVFNSNYCLLPGCCERTWILPHFCSFEHFKKAQRQGYSGLVRLEKTCDEYRELETHFSKNWSKKKGQLPQILNILKIVNPHLEEKLETYTNHLPKDYKKIKRYYHGTQIKCDLLEYLQPCSDSTCAICSITQNGFDPDRISTSTWQRFGRGFYLAPNSSKAYDYPLSGRGEPPPVPIPYRAILVCDVAPGRKYILHKNEPRLQGPPPGYHSVYGQAKWMLNMRRSPDLNYDELVVFDAEALRPSFILFFRN